MVLNLVERLNFNRTFGKHTVGSLLAMEANMKENYYLSSSGMGFINDKMRVVSSAIEVLSASGSRSSTRGLSYIMQGSYSYDSRYYLTANARLDGASGFGTDAKWKPFAAIGASWNIDKEKFFQLKDINVLKLKASFGSSGNSRLGSQEALGLYSYSSGDNYMNEAGATMSGPQNLGLSWEIAYASNLGLRIRMFDKIDLEVELYRKKTVDLLSNLNVSLTSGDTRAYRNSGELLNQGIEATLAIDVFKTKDFSWILQLNASHNKNKLLDLYNGLEKVMGNYIWREGYDINTLYLIRWAGVDPRDGAPLWYDANGNITRTYSADNRVPWKSAEPAVTGGLTNALKYKQFNLNTIFTYVLGGYAFSTFGRNVSSDGLYIMSQNQSINQMDRWQEPGDIASTPKLIWGVSTKSVMNSTRYVYKTTYVKLKNVSLSYSLPEKWIKMTGLSSFRLSAIADNLIVWSPYSKPNRNSYSQSIGGYPMETTYTFGIDFSF